jgi:hypothetical protein
MSRRPPLTEIEDIHSGLIAYTGITTADGDVGGTYLICSALIGSDDFITNKMILLQSGPHTIEDSGAVSFVPGTGRINVGVPFGGQVLRGVHFFILNTISPSLAAYILSKLGGETPVSGSVVANWFAGEQLLCTIGAHNLRKLIHNLSVDIIATGGNINIRMYMAVNGNVRMIFPPKPVTWNKLTDSTGVPVINGTYGVHEAVVVTCQSDAPGDNGVAIGFDYFTQAMQ